MIATHPMLGFQMTNAWFDGRSAARGIDPARANARKEIRAFMEQGRIAEEGLHVIRRFHRPAKLGADPLRGLFQMMIELKLASSNASPTAI